MPANVTFANNVDALADSRSLVFVGRASQLLSETVRRLLPASLSGEVWTRMVRTNDPGDFGRVVSTWLDGEPQRVVAGILPEVCSRHNSPSRAWAIPGVVAGAGAKGPTAFVLAVSEPEHAFAAALGLARAHPTFTAGSKTLRREVTAGVLLPDGSWSPPESLQIAADAVRRAAHLVDQPPNQLTPTEFIAQAQALAGRHDAVELTVYQGRELSRLGFGGLWGVGKAAASPPALIVLDHAPVADARRVVWVGKGITYDTGGLSLKSKTGMPGMKNDMGGAAAVFAAFEGAVKLGCTDHLTAVLCVAENAIGPDATRPDDVLRMYSGRTVEVNNTDAEGRLVLADGVAWAVRQRRPERLIDLATLTGAQSVATGKTFAALYANGAAIEQEAIRAGRAAGEPCHALPFAPELFRREFSSSIADMKNSVKDRANAQSSCAGQFIGNHLGRYDGEWLHVDMAGPVVSGGRATGYGVGLLLTLAGVGA